MKVFLDNFDAPRKAKARDITFYMDEIRNRFGLVFDKLEAFCTDGDIRPPYPYQWRATAIVVPGSDDPMEGLGGSPHEAVYALWQSARDAEKNKCFDEDEI
jgi:hypothetical protein